MKFFKFILYLITSIPKQYRKYIIILLLFLVYIIFFDKNNKIHQYEQKQKLNKLKADKEYYLNEIENIKEKINNFSSDTMMIEKFARERYLMKRDNEEIFVIINETK